MSTTMDRAAPTRPPLEAAAQAFADATAKPPFLYDLGPEKGREVVNQTQAGDIAKPAVDDEWITVPGGPKPPGTRDPLTARMPEDVTRSSHSGGGRR